MSDEYVESAIKTTRIKQLIDDFRRENPNATLEERKHLYAILTALDLEDLELLVSGIEKKAEDL